jgi:uncharacterized protein involved in type VI secretion and phage assembly
MIEQAPDGGGSRYFGLYPAFVSDIVDPDRLGRIEVRLPWLGADGDGVRAWATLLTPYAGDGQGLEILPEVDSQVVVAFEAGDLRRPYIVGACWNGQASLPEAPARPNNKRLLKTRAGSLLEFDDSSGSARVTLSLASGSKLVLDDGAQEVKLVHQNGCTLKMDASGNVTVTALSAMTINAPSGLTVNAPSTTFSGNVTCMAHTATAVTSPLYSQGAGNIW